MTLERFEQVKRFVLFQEPCEPPPDSSDYLTVFLFAENWIKTADRMFETIRTMRAK
jgi:hypothetical protein